MSEVENLVLEQLRLIRSDINDLNSEIKDLKLKIRVLDTRIASIATLQSANYSDIADNGFKISNLESRIYRLEEKK